MLPLVNKNCIKNKLKRRRMNFDLLFKPSLNYLRFRLRSLWRCFLRHRFELVSFLDFNFRLEVADARFKLLQILRGMLS